MTIHVSDKQGARLQGATVSVEQVSKDFPFGSAINNNIIGNLPYQVHFYCATHQYIMLKTSQLFEFYFFCVFFIRDGLLNDLMQPCLKMS